MKKSNKPRPDGLIRVSVYLGSVDGKRKYKAVYGRTQKEADKKALEVKMRLGVGVDILSESTKFQVFREAWLNEKRRTVSAASFPTYEGYSATWAALDGFPVNKVMELHIQALIDDYAAKNPHTAKPTAKKTLISLRAAVCQMLAIAVRNGAIVRNPADGVVIPASAPKKQRTALTDTQVKWVEETPHRAQTAAMLMLYAGLRRGELFALTWNDIDLAERTITINKSAEIVGNVTSVKNQTKTAAGMRVVYFPQRLADYLQQVKRTSLLVLTTEAGKPVTKSAFSSLWYSYMLELNAKYGVDPHFNKYNRKGVIFTIDTFTAHQLRHTFASMCYKAGIDVLTAKELLGHADIKTTLQVYTHLDGQYKKKTVDKFDDYLTQCDQNANSKKATALDT